MIVSHVQAGGQRCRLVLTGTGYTVADQTEPAARGTLSRLLMGRTGLVVLAIVLIFAAAVAAFSFFTSRTIVRPIQKIARERTPLPVAIWIIRSTMTLPMSWAKRWRVLTPCACG